MATRLPVAVKNASCSYHAGLPDAGGAAGRIEIRTGLQPATADDPAVGTLLATAVLNFPAYGAPVAGVAPLVLVPAITCAGVAVGTAGWYRMFDSTGTRCRDGSVTLTGLGGDITMNIVNIVIGAAITVTSGSLTIPG